jgi:hypothetical protein
MRVPGRGREAISRLLLETVIRVPEFTIRPGVDLTGLRVFDSPAGSRVEGEGRSKLPPRRATQIPLRAVRPPSRDRRYATRAPPESLAACPGRNDRKTSVARSSQVDAEIGRSSPAGKTARSSWGTTGSGGSPGPVSSSVRRRPWKHDAVARHPMNLVCNPLAAGGRTQAWSGESYERWL